jgi:hypothetical protein
MNRGPPPQSAIDAALKIALARGFVTCSKRGRGSVCDFIIHIAGYTAVILVLRSRRLHGSLAEMEAQAAEAIARLRLVPEDPCRSRELWACSPHGVLRFFRVLNNGLIELDRDGKPFGSTGNMPGVPG